MAKLLSLLITVIAAVLYILLESETSLNTKEDSIKKDEKYYQNKMCSQLGGEMEYTLFDKTRVDCLTSEYAIEVDFAKKWAEGIGQSLYYAQITNKKPAVALIVGDDDEKYLKRIQIVADKFDIKIIILEK